MRMLRRIRGRGLAKGGAAFSLVPLILFALVTAFLFSESSVTLAYPLFQSPLQTPEPSEGPVSPPEQSPVVPSLETPFVPPGESPVLPSPEGPEGSPTPAGEPQATPGEGVPEGAATVTPGAAEEGIPSPRGPSLAVLIDALVVALSSLWLCFGGLVLVIFVILVVASFVLRVT